MFISPQAYTQKKFLPRDWTEQKNQIYFWLLNPFPTLSAAFPQPPSWPVFPSATLGPDPQPPLSFHLFESAENKRKASAAEVLSSPGVACPGATLCTMSDGLRKVLLRDSSIARMILCYQVKSCVPWQ